MEKIISKLFHDYLSEQKVSLLPEFSVLSKQALQKEQNLRDKLKNEQTVLFEELFDLTSQIHYLEVKDAFINGCKLGAKASKEFTI